MNQYIITEEELNQIKNDCYHPNTLSCEECEFASDGINPCTWKGANALMDEVMTHPYQSERDIDEWCKVHSEVIKDIQTSAYREGYHDGEVVGAKGERDKVLELCDKEQKKLTFDSSFATDNAYNEGRLSIIKIIKAELRQAGE